MYQFDSYVQPIGSLDPVNTTVNGTQNASQVTALAGGGYVVVWFDGSGALGAGTLGEIRGQRFDANGARVGGEYVVDQVTNTNVRAPSVSATANGGFVVAWADLTNGTRARVFDQSGSAVTGDFSVQDTLNVNVVETSVATLADGHYMIAWREQIPASGNVPAHYVVRAKIYDATNNAVTGTLDFGQPDATVQFSIATAAVGDQFVFTWSASLPSGTGNPEVFAQRISATGTFLGTATQVNTVTANSQSQTTVTALADGGYVVAYSSVISGSDGVIAFQRFDHQGNKVGDETLASGVIFGTEIGARVVQLKDGSFAIAWTHIATATPGSSDTLSGVYMQQFLADGTAIGDAIQIGLSQGDGPSLAVLDSGRFVATYTEHFLQEPGAFSLSPGIRQQMFEPYKLLLGTEAGETLTATNAPSAIEGFGGDDILHGGTAADHIAGGDGDDTITGGGGADLIFGGAGNDSISLNGSGAQAPGASVFGEDGNDTIVAVNGVYHLDGGDGDDHIILSGGQFGSFVSGGTGTNVINASGTGNITLIAAEAGSIDDITVSGFTGGNIVSDGDDIIHMAGTNNVSINAGGGHHTIVTATTVRTMAVYGFSAGEAGDTLDLTAFGADPFGSGALTLQTLNGNAVITGANGFAVTLSGVDARNLSAFNLGVANTQYHPQDMVLDGFNPGADISDYLVGADGNDTIRGHGGDDMLFGGGGNDLIDAGTGSDSAFGGSGNDIFLFGAAFDATDRVDGGTGSDDQLRLQGNYTGAGDIVLTGGQVSAIDLILLASGQDTRLGAPAGPAYSYDLTTDDSTVAAGGTLTIQAKRLLVGENLHFNGAAETNGAFKIYSGAGDDVITGGALADLVSAGAGSDRITGGGGADNLFGEGGNDTFVYLAASDSTTAARDHILDYAAGDAIDVSALGLNHFIGSGAFGHHAGEVRAAFVGSFWQIEGDVNGDGVADLSILVTALASYGWGAGDFVLAPGGQGAAVPMGASGVPADDGDVGHVSALPALVSLAGEHVL